MEMKRNKKQSPSPSPPSDLEKANDGGRGGAEDVRKLSIPSNGGGAKFSYHLLVGVLLTCLLALSILAMLVAGVVNWQSTSELLVSVDRRVFGRDEWESGGKGSHWVHRHQEEVDKGSHNFMTRSTRTTTEKLLGGLLAAEFDDESCMSKYESALIRNESPHKPSSYLQERLRKYEDLHKKCAPYTELYNSSIHQLKSNQSSGDQECKYLVWISYSGLGNRILSLTSAFLYAILTNRVLLIDRGADMVDLFCEPFPEGSWLLPLDFPLNHLESFDQVSPYSYGNMLKNKVINNDANAAPIGYLPGHIYVHLSHDYDKEDKLFFCEQDQLILQKIPWMILRSNNYFVPSLFLIPAYEEELRQLFPKKDTVFHHLGRYLFHPTNSVWGMISRYYQAYLARADEIIGIQIRIFDEGTGPFPYVLDQIFSCISSEKLLPAVDLEQSLIQSDIGKSKAVLVTSLSSGYFEKIRNVYWEYPTVNGDIVGVYQPSQEEHQQTENHSHNMKAWAEMYLLSLSDVLVTSSWSTFGYVAQGLGGLKPWILSKPVNRTTPDPPCSQAMSMEPCFHAPPFYDCKAKTGVDTGALVPHVRHCEDMSWGLKVVDRSEL